jgi:hypothetical protein
MTQRRRPQISSEADLARVIGTSESYAIEDWLQDRCEFADGFDDDGGEQAFRRVIFFHGNSVHGQYTIDIPYPFELTQLEDEADRAEHYFRSVINASCLNNPEATLGALGADGDVTTDLASELLNDADPAELAAALGSTWSLIDLAVRTDSAGDEIHAWFIPDDDRRVALGIGAVNLIVVPLRGTDIDGYEVEEWPDPTVDLLSDWHGGANQTDSADCVRQLARAIAVCADRRAT